MRDAAQGVGLLLAATLTFSVFGLSNVALGADNAAGHALADKFAKEAEPPKRKSQAAQARPAEKKKIAAPDPQKAEEAEMLAQARAEAEQRRAELEKARLAAEETERAQAALAAAEAQKAEADRIAEAGRREREKAELARREAEEAELTRQAALAEARRQAEIEARHLAEARRVEEARRVSEARRVEQARLDDERRAAEERKLAEQRRAEEERHAAEITAAAAEQERRRIAETKRQEEERIAQQRRAEDSLRLAQEHAERERQATLAAERESEGRRITERLRQAEAARIERERQRVSQQAIGERDAEPPAPPRPAVVEVAPPPRFPAPVTQANSDPRVTVLIVMEPGHRGIRRHNKTADPVLCSMTGCYVSGGAEQAAAFYPGHRALGFSRTFGERAGPCANSLGCVFRGIDLATLDNYLQPIDMRVVRHDRRQPQQVRAASDCFVAGGRLQCRDTIDGGDYVMWIVPESVAASAGPALLARAVEDGLPPPQQASLYGYQR